VEQTRAIMARKKQQQQQQKQQETEVEQTRAAMARKQQQQPARDIEAAQQKPHQQSSPALAATSSFQDCSGCIGLPGTPRTVVQVVSF
jgi:hypothetical protein